MWAASPRRWCKYLRNCSVTASATSTVAAASTLSEALLPGSFDHGPRSWPAKSIRRRAVQRVLPDSGSVGVAGQLLRQPHFLPPMLSWCTAPACRPDEEQLVDLEHHRARGGTAECGSWCGASDRRG